MKKTIVEFIGTLFLVSTVGNTVLNPGGAGNFAPLAIGVILMTMIFAGGHIVFLYVNPETSMGTLETPPGPEKEAPLA